MRRLFRWKADIGALAIAWTLGVVPSGASGALDVQVPGASSAEGTYRAAGAGPAAALDTAPRQILALDPAMPLHQMTWIQASPRVDAGRPVPAAVAASLDLPFSVLPQGPPPLSLQPAGPAPLAAPPASQGLDGGSRKPEAAVSALGRLTDYVPTTGRAPGGIDAAKTSLGDDFFNTSAAQATAEGSFGAAGAPQEHQGIRAIRFARAAADPEPQVRMAETYLAALAHMRYLGGVPGSRSVTRLKPLFQLGTQHVATLDPTDPGFLLIKPEGQLPRYGSYRYVDLTNGSRFSTQDGQGRLHHFVAVRGLREGYAIRVDLKTGVPATEKYVSDELLFEADYDASGNAVSMRFVAPLVLSTSEDILVQDRQFVFEDGRVYEPVPGRKVISGTVIADFLHRPKTISYRNAFAELVTDSRTGIPRVKTDPGTGDPAWHYISPVASDFKNGMVLSDGHGREVVALLRSYAAAAEGIVPAGYSLIRLAFPDYETFLKYDFNHLPEDLKAPGRLRRLERPHPTQAGVLLATEDLREPYAADPRVTRSGFGTGAKPARVSMRSNGDVYLEEALGAPAVKLGSVPREQRKGFILQPGQKKWLFLGHQLRYYRDGIQFRDYNAFAWLTDARMLRVERVRNGLMTAETPLESGWHSLIVDLARHNYPMGSEVMNGEYHFSYGASDKHTGAAKLDVLALLREMSDGSPEMRAGLAYAVRRGPAGGAPSAQRRGIMGESE